MLDVNQLKLFNATVIAAIVTAIVAFVSKIIELIILWRNKKKEIDYKNEAEIKRNVREHAKEIVSSANEVAVGINTLVDMWGKSIEIAGGRQILFQNLDKAKKKIQKTGEDNVEKINLNALKIAEHVIQYELLFADYKYEHEAIKKANKLLELTVDFKEILFEIQDDFNEENFNTGKEKLEQLRGRLNETINLFSNETRKTLRTFRYSLRGSIRISDRIEFIIRKFRNERAAKTRTDSKSQWIYLLIGLVFGIAISFWRVTFDVLKFLAMNVIFSLFKFILSNLSFLFFVTTIVFVCLWIKERKKKNRD